MPRALDPRKTFEVWLDGDADKQPRPTFVCKYLTGAEWIEVATVGERVEKGRQAGTPQAMVEPIYTALRISIVDWEHMTGRDGAEIRFAQSRLEELLDVIEAQELIGKVLAACSARADDAKKSESPAQSRQESSAGIAVADVMTSPASGSPSSSAAQLVEAAAAATVSAATSR